MTGSDPTFEDPRAVLKRYELRPKRSWGQNFLVSPRAVKVIADACVDGIAPGEVVVEIGAGVGTLTASLLGRGASVIAIERDREMCRILRSELGRAAGFTLLEEDAAKVDFVALFGGVPGTLVGNLPYQLTGRLIRGIVASAGRARRAVIMVQREVAERLTASPGDRGRGALSVIAQARFENRIIHRLKPTAFHPPPKVSSCVVLMAPLERTVFDAGLDAGAFDRIVSSAFSGRRKTLRNALGACGPWPTTAVDALIARAGIDGALRPERLSVDQFAALVAAAIELGICVVEPAECL